MELIGAVCGWSGSALLVTFMGLVIAGATDDDSILVHIVAWLFIVAAAVFVISGLILFMPWAIIRLYEWVLPVVAAVFFS